MAEDDVGAREESPSLMRSIDLRAACCAIAPIWSRLSMANRHHRVLNGRARATTHIEDAPELGHLDAGFNAGDAQTLALHH
jgi:hypothetical protein